MTQEQEKVLDKLSNGRIFHITDSEDGTINFMEMCDQFYATLFFSVLSWVAVIFIFILLLKDGYYNNKPAPKWFR